MRYRRKPATPLNSQPYDQDLELTNCVVMPINWLRYALEALADDCGTTVAKIRQRVACWEQHKPLGARPLRVDEQREQFELFFPLPDGVFWSVADLTYKPGNDSHTVRQQARVFNLLHKGWMGRATAREVA